MGQLTLARFRGDTAFGLVARLISTFFGGLLGMVIWYISSGRGSGNAIGLAAVCAVAFPLMIFGRLYYPGPPMTVIVFFVTIVLVRKNESPWYLSYRLD
jgi:4-amino-4-deoxy-L-arabinose transferase-like glycosyltransferase